MTKNPYTAYKKQQDDDPRLNEARALLKAAALLEEVQKQGISYFDYSEAVKANRNLWTFFQASLVEESSHLPDKLKDVLKGLSVYVDRRSLRAMAKQNPQMLNVLININKEVAAGLMESLKNFPQAAVQQSTSAPPTQGMFVGERV
jgi:flagellar protein FlaF